MNYPRPITSIKQIEVTTECNLRCVYCPSPKLPRPKMHMDMAIFERALLWAKHFDKLGTQKELALTGIGEGLLHPNIVEMVRMARRALPSGQITMSTNGVALTEDMAREFGKERLELFVSLHRPEKAGPAMNLAKEYGILFGINDAFATQAVSWAGQVEWAVTAPKLQCAFLAVGWGVVMVEGKITTCCYDASGAGIIGDVRDEPSGVGMKPYALCATCEQVPP